MQGNSTVYIKKLVKVVYEKERQIEQMKRVLRERRGNGENEGPEIEKDFKKEIESTSSQLREVNMQVLSMERKMMQLGEELKQEIIKSNQLEDENSLTKVKYEENCKLLTFHQEHLAELEG